MSMKHVFVGAVGAALAFTWFGSSSASAAVVCNGNICWHTSTAYEYPSTAKIIVHEDDWKAGPGITFREHEGRGYWRDETWVVF